MQGGRGGDWSNPCREDLQISTSRMSKFFGKRVKTKQRQQQISRHGQDAESQEKRYGETVLSP